MLGNLNIFDKFEWYKIEELEWRDWKEEENCITNV